MSDRVPRLLLRRAAVKPRIVFSENFDEGIGGEGLNSIRIRVILLLSSQASRECHVLLFRQHDYCNSMGSIQAGMGPRVPKEVNLAAGCRLPCTE